MKKSTIVAAALASALLSTAHAQTVYRCGSAYSQLPCGPGKVVEVDDARSPAQQAEAQRVADDERRLAADMRRERLTAQRIAAPALAVSLGGQPAPKATAEQASPADPRHKKRHAIRKVPARAADFVAFDPTTRKRRSGN